MCRPAVKEEGPDEELEQTGLLGQRSMYIRPGYAYARKVTRFLAQFVLRCVGCLVRISLFPDLVLVLLPRGSQVGQMDAKSTCRQSR